MYMYMKLTMWNYLALIFSHVLISCSLILPFSHSPIPILPVHLLETRVAMQTFEEDHRYSIHTPTKSLSSSDMIMVSLGLFEQAERGPAGTEPLYVNRAVELTTAWIRDVYDL